MPLKAGQLDVLVNFVDADCMARYIDDQLPPIPSLPPGVDSLNILKKRREFMIQLSEGVINYLKAHGNDSFILTTTCPAGPGTGKVTIT